MSFRLLTVRWDYPTRRSGGACVNDGRRSSRHRQAVAAHNVRVFGSVARGDATKTSDIDLLVDLDKGVGLLDLIGLENELRDLLGVDVDVVPADTLKPRMRARVLREAIPL